MAFASEHDDPTRREFGVVDIVTVEEGAVDRCRTGPEQFVRSDATYINPEQCTHCSLYCFRVVEVGAIG